MNLLKITTPINLNSEKEKFFNSESYNPQFQYNWDSIGLDSLTKKTKKDVLIKAIFNQDNEQIIQKALTFFETDLNKFKGDASNILKTKPSTFNYRIEDFQKGFENAFKFFNLMYTIYISEETGFNFRPD